MRKNILLFIIATVATLLLHAQSYEVLNYQGVLKNPDGSIRPNTEARIVLEFVQENNIVYSESHDITTNPNGYFSLHPGNGNSISGIFSNIDWGYAPMTMRSIINDEIIAETHLTSVPYALYALRFAGEEAMQSSIDSVSDAHLLTSLQVDDQALLIENLTLNHEVLQYHIDSLHVSISELSITDSITAQHIDSLYNCILNLSANDSITAQHIDSLATVATIFNATAQAPLIQGKYHTSQTAIEAVPQHMRKNGLIVTFRRDTLSWHSIQYNNNDTTEWDNIDKWNNYNYFGNLVVPFATNDSLTRLQIPQEQRRQGLIISYYNNSQIVNEQFIGNAFDNVSWSDNNAWVQLLFTSEEINKMKKDIARIDTLVNDVKKGMQDMSTFGAWFYIGHNEKFSQAGGVNYQGKEVSDLTMVHTPLIPIEDLWFVTTYGNNNYPGISFFADNNFDNRLAFEGDTLLSENWQKQTFDFSTDEIPRAARYFSLNMLLEKKSEIELKKRTPITNVIDTSVKYAFQDQNNMFNYIGTYVGCNGKRVIHQDFRHSRFVEIGNDVYKVMSTGCYNEEFITPIVVYYTDMSFNNAIGYDLGEVNSDGYTSREIIISRETAPEGAEYFIVNCIPNKGAANVFLGRTTEYALNNADSRLSIIENNLSCYSGRKLVTLGDSFTINSGNRSKTWQQWLCEWLGVTWSADETTKGKNGYSPMGVGGSWVMPNDINAMSLRCMDIRRYAPNIIIIYGGQNDKLGSYSLGSIEDEPFIPSQIIDLTNRSTVNSLADAIDYMSTNNKVPAPQTILHINASWGKQLYFIEDTTQWRDTQAWIHPIDSVSFYSAYKGMVERVCTQNPLATIYCLTFMQCDSTRYDNSLGSWEEVDEHRRLKCQAIKEIAQQYGVQVIDLWNQSGVTPYNAPSLYSDWLHPNQYGYRRLAESIYRAIK